MGSQLASEVHQATPLTGVRRVLETIDDEYVNELLAAGWSLLAVCIVDDGWPERRDESFRYSLCWMKDSPPVSP